MAERDEERRNGRRHRKTARIDQPREAARRLLPRPTLDSDTFGRFAEGFARFMGTAQFLFGMTIFILIWILWNTAAPAAIQFDKPWFILLNLIFSTQASYAAPLILLAQNRQDDRDRVAIEADRARDERNLADTEFLTREVASLRLAMRETATRDFVRSELRSLLEEMDERGYLRTPDPTDEDDEPAPA